MAKSEKQYRITGSFANSDEIAAGTARRFGYDCQIVELEDGGEVFHALIPHIADEALLALELKHKRITPIATAPAAAKTKGA